MNTNKGTVGKPIYSHRDYVEFIYQGQTLEGVIAIIDSYGTIEQAEEPSYDIEVGGEDFSLYKHIRESDIIRKVWNDESMEVYRRALLDCKRVLKKTTVSDEGKGQLLAHIQTEIERVSQLVDINSENKKMK